MHKNVQLFLKIIFKDYPRNAWCLDGEKSEESTKFYDIDIINDVREAYKILNSINSKKKIYALFENDFESGGFEWVEGNDYENSCFTFIRHDKKNKENPHLREAHKRLAKEIIIDLHGFCIYPNCSNYLL